MPGGLLQLTFNGYQDKLLTNNPEITYFKTVYRKYTNFSIDTITTKHDLQYNSTKIINIAKTGDLLYKMYVSLTLPAISTFNNIPKINNNTSTYSNFYSTSKKLFSINIYLNNITNLLNKNIDIFNINNNNNLSINDTYYINKFINLLLINIYYINDNSLKNLIIKTFYNELILQNYNITITTIYDYISYLKEQIYINFMKLSFLRQYYISSNYSSNNINSIMINLAVSGSLINYNNNNLKYLVFVDKNDKNILIPVIISNYTSNQNKLDYTGYIVNLDYYNFLSKEKSIYKLNLITMIGNYIISINNINSTSTLLSYNYVITANITQDYTLLINILNNMDYLPIYLNNTSSIPYIILLIDKTQNATYDNIIGLRIYCKNNNKPYDINNLILLSSFIPVMENNKIISTSYYKTFYSDCLNITTSFLLPENIYIIYNFINSDISINITLNINSDFSINTNIINFTPTTFLNNYKFNNNNFDNTLLSILTTFKNNICASYKVIDKKDAIINLLKLPFTLNNISQINIIYRDNSTIYNTFTQNNIIFTLNSNNYNKILKLRLTTVNNNLTIKQINYIQINNKLFYSHNIINNYSIKYIYTIFHIIQINTSIIDIYLTYYSEIYLNNNIIASGIDESYLDNINISSNIINLLKINFSYIPTINNNSYQCFSFDNSVNYYINYDFNNNFYYLYNYTLSLNNLNQLNYNILINNSNNNINNNIFDIITFPTYFNEIIINSSNTTNGNVNLNDIYILLLYYSYYSVSKNNNNLSISTIIMLYIQYTSIIINNNNSTNNTLTFISNLQLNNLLNMNNIYNLPNNIIFEADKYIYSIYSDYYVSDINYALLKDSINTILINNNELITIDSINKILNYNFNLNNIINIISSLAEDIPLYSNGKIKQNPSGVQITSNINIIEYMPIANIDVIKIKIIETKSITDKFEINNIIEHINKTTICTYYDIKTNISNYVLDNINNKFSINILLEDIDILNYNNVIAYINNNPEIIGGSDNINNFINFFNNKNNIEPKYLTYSYAVELLNSIIHFIITDNNQFNLCLYINNNIYNTDVINNILSNYNIFTNLLYDNEYSTLTLYNIINVNIKLYLIEYLKNSTISNINYDNYFHNNLNYLNKNTINTIITNLFNDNIINENKKNYIINNIFFNDVSTNYISYNNGLYLYNKLISSIIIINIDTYILLSETTKNDIINNLILNIPQTTLDSIKTMVNSNIELFNEDTLYYKNIFNNINNYVKNYFIYYFITSQVFNNYNFNTQINIIYNFINSIDNFLLYDNIISSLNTLLSNNIITIEIYNTIIINTINNNNNNNNNLLNHDTGSLIYKEYLIKTDIDLLIIYINNILVEKNSNYNPEQLIYAIKNNYPIDAILNTAINNYYFYCLICLNEQDSIINTFINNNNNYVNTELNIILNNLSLTSNLSSNILINYIEYNIGNLILAKIETTSITTITYDYINNYIKTTTNLISTENILNLLELSDSSILFLNCINILNKITETVSLQQISMQQILNLLYNYDINLYLHNKLNESLLKIIYYDNNNNIIADSIYIGNNLKSVSYLPRIDIIKELVSSNCMKNYPEIVNSMISLCNQNIVNIIFYNNLLNNLEGVLISEFSPLTIKDLLYYLIETNNYNILQYNKLSGSDIYDNINILYNENYNIICNDVLNLFNSNEGNSKTTLNNYINNLQLLLNTITIPISNKIVKDYDKYNYLFNLTYSNIKYQDLIYYLYHSIITQFYNNTSIDIYSNYDSNVIYNNYSIFFGGTINIINNIYIGPILKINFSPCDCSDIRAEKINKGIYPTLTINNIENMLNYFSLVVGISINKTTLSSVKYSNLINKHFNNNNFILIFYLLQYIDNFIQLNITINNRLLTIINSNPITSIIYNNLNSISLILIHILNHFAISNMLNLNNIYNLNTYKNDTIITSYSCYDILNNYSSILQTNLEQSNYYCYTILLSNQYSAYDTMKTSINNLITSYYESKVYYDTYNIINNDTTILNLSTELVEYNDNNIILFKDYVEFKNLNEIFSLTNINDLYNYLVLNYNTYRYIISSTIGSYIFRSINNINNIIKDIYNNNIIYDIILCAYIPLINDDILVLYNNNINSIVDSRYVKLFDIIINNYVDIFYTTGLNNLTSKDDILLRMNNTTVENKIKDCINTYNSLNLLERINIKNIFNDIKNINYYLITTNDENFNYSGYKYYNIIMTNDEYSVIFDDILLYDFNIGSIGILIFTKTGNIYDINNIYLKTKLDINSNIYNFTLYRKTDLPDEYVYIFDDNYNITIGLKYKMDKLDNILLNEISIYSNNLYINYLIRIYLISNDLTLINILNDYDKKKILYLIDKYNNNYQLDTIVLIVSNILDYIIFQDISNNIIFFNYISYISYLSVEYIIKMYNKDRTYISNIIMLLYSKIPNQVILLLEKMFNSDNKILINILSDIKFINNDIFLKIYNILSIKYNFNIISNNQTILLNINLIDDIKYQMSILYNIYINNTSLGSLDEDNAKIDYIVNFILSLYNYNNTLDLIENPVLYLMYNMYISPDYNNMYKIIIIKLIILDNSVKTIIENYIKNIEFNYINIINNDNTICNVINFSLIEYNCYSDEQEITILASELILTSLKSIKIINKIISEMHKIIKVDDNIFYIVDSIINYTNGVYTNLSYNKYNNFITGILFNGVSYSINDDFTLIENNSLISIIFIKDIIFKKDDNNITGYLNTGIINIKILDYVNNYVIISSTYFTNIKIVNNIKLGLNNIIRSNNISIYGTDYMILDIFSRFNTDKLLLKFINKFSINGNINNSNTFLDYLFSIISDSSLNLSNIIDNSLSISNYIINIHNNINKVLSEINNTYNIKINYNKEIEDYFKIPFKSKVAYISYLEDFIFENIKLSIDGNIIDELSDTYLHIYHNIIKQYSPSRNKYYNVNVLASNAHSQKKIYIDIPLYFSEVSGVSYPLIASLYSNIDIIFKIRDIEDILIKNKYVNISYKNKINMEIMYSIIYLDEFERNIVSSLRHEYLYEKKLYNLSSNLSQNKNHLYFPSPIKDIFYYIQSKKMLDARQYYNFTLNYILPELNLSSRNKYEYLKQVIEFGYYDNLIFDLYTICSNIININNNDLINRYIETEFNNYYKNIYYIYSKINLQTILYMNNVIRVSNDNMMSSIVIPHTYYNNILPGLHIINFSLKPLEYQPSGNCNLSHFKTDIQLLYLIEDVSDVKINTIARSYNIIRFIGGNCGIAW